MTDSAARRLGPLLAPLAGEADASPAAALSLLVAAESLVEAGLPVPLPPEDDAQWRRYLSLTRHPRFLTALPGAAERERWLATVLAVCEAVGFTIADLLDQRAAEIPDRILLHELQEPGAGPWNYGQIRRRVRSTAAMLLGDAPAFVPPGGDPAAAGGGPRVALLAANSIAAACCDLACLYAGILVTPLNTHTSPDDLAWIFTRLGVTAAVCDTPERLDVLLTVRRRTARPFVIYTLYPSLQAGSHDIRQLEERRSRLSAPQVDRILAERPRPDMRAVATVMFTSGSTGRPKGVAFSQLNMVSKRFARAAALPQVGRDEVMLCYLPLYHTFGRFLELMGTIFWGGTYVFAGNPSTDTLLAQFQQVRPTGLISVPVRWQQIRDRALEAARDLPAGGDPGEGLRRVVGDQLRWGLSAAGYLDPKIFRFFHSCGVALCSGFGMTEGTGGLTMTPPDDYLENSVGVPLPAARTRLTAEGELQICGPYIARYLPEDGAPGDLTVEHPLDDDYWLSTGDLFRRMERGHLEIVDRIKDIYKNDKGQTIAPRRVESLFEHVPGVKRTFLAGDGRSYNTLLIVPDPQDEVLRSLAVEEDRRQYFQQIVTAANPALASYERVVNFAVLDRDFSAELGEITPKGTLRRKTIEQNFAAVIAGLYQADDRVLQCGRLRVRIPRWIFRDLGVVEDAVAARGQALVIGEGGRRLTVAPGAEGRVRLGDLEYEVAADKGGRVTVDLGLMIRQPLLWVGNPELMRFAPCRAGWDTELGAVSGHVYLPAREQCEVPLPEDAVPPQRELQPVGRMCAAALFGALPQALEAVAQMDRELKIAGPRLGTLLRRRLQTLARHPVKDVRCRAYQVLVLERPEPDYLQYLPAFIASGLPFLDDQSFEAISRASLEPRRLLALRQRMHYYREQLAWPAGERTRQLFTDLFKLLADFGRFHPDFYGTIREELVSWILHDKDPVLAAAAAREFNDLAAWFEVRLRTDYDGIDPQAWADKIAFQEGLNAEEVQRLRQVLIGTTFLRESLMLAFEGEDLPLQDIPPGGIWVSRIISRFEDSRFRVSINTRHGKHFDLQLIIRQDIDQDLVMQTIYWYIALRGCVFGRAILPSFGCCRPELGAISMAYVSDLTVWEKVREFSSVRGPGTTPPSRMAWQQLMVRAMAVVVRGWHHSGRRIIPGLITPYNIVVPEPDFRTGSVQNNLTGWKPYAGPLSLIRPLWRNVVHHTVSHYPWTEFYLENRWVFEAFVEALGVAEARVWLLELQRETAGGDEGMWTGFARDLEAFAASLRDRYYQPLTLRGAVHRYDDWERGNAQAPVAARLNIIEELARLYQIDKLPEIARFALYRHTYFRQAPLPLLDCFDRLLVRLHRQGDHRASQMVELSDLQAALQTQEDHQAFARMAFPAFGGREGVEVLTLGDPARDQVVVRSTITDRRGRRYTVRQPSSPAEVGILYRLFLQAGFPKTISEADRYLVILDEAEQTVGGAVYREQEDQTVFLDGVVVAQTLAERGIAGAILQDFSTRMTSQGIRAIMTHFFLRRFYERHGFRLDHRLGSLVRFL